MAHLRIVLLACIGLGWACLCGIRPATAAEDGLQARLTQLVQAERDATGTPGLVVWVQPRGADAVGAAAGVANRDTNRLVTADDTFAIGSIGKMLVATTILQLADEGVLALDDPLGKFIPDFPHAQEITLRMLLQHTSGLGDPTEDLAVGRGNWYTQTWTILALMRQWSHEELVQMLAQQPLEHAPGTYCRYSNGNFILLGRVIELATGHSVASELHRRIFDPLGMEHTVLVGEDPLPLTDIRCYMQRDGQYIDCLAFENASLAWTAGALASTAQDLLQFARAYIEGGLIPAGMRDARYAWTPIQDWGDYGLGVMKQGEGALLRYGHTGRTVGFSTALWYFPADGCIVVVLCNLQHAPTTSIALKAHALAVAPVQ